MVCTDISLLLNSEYGGHLNRSTVVYADSIRSNDAGRRRQHVADLRRVLAPRFGEVRPPAPAPTHDGRELFDDLTGGDLLGQIGCDADDNRDLVVGRARQDDDATS